GTAIVKGSLSIVRSLALHMGVVTAPVGNIVFDFAMTIHQRAIFTSLRSVASWWPHKEGVKLFSESVKRGHVRLAVFQQTSDVSENLVAAGARHNDGLQPSLTRTAIAKGMGMAGQDDRHRSRLGGQYLVTNLDLIRSLQKAKNFELMAMHMER